MSNLENKSYLSAGINALSPWGSRSSTPKPPEARAADEASGPQRGGDHSISHGHRLSSRNYPRDCPALNVQWFHAVDIPKRKPLPSGQPPARDDKPPIAPKKYAAFSKHDSRAIETAFQKVSEERDTRSRKRHRRGDEDVNVSTSSQPHSGHETNTSIDEAESVEQPGKVRVPVNEDFLFDVDVERRELAPAYWLGPIYEVRRGTWFYQESSSLKPCDENLAAQLEEGYLKIKPWRASPSLHQRSASQPRTRPTSLKPGEDLSSSTKSSMSTPVTPKSSVENLGSANVGASPKPVEAALDASSPQQAPANTHRLFGAHMNSVVTYQDATTTWLLTDDFMSRMSSNMYQRFAGGGHFAGLKMVRGYSDVSKKTEPKDGKAASTPTKATFGEEVHSSVQEKVDSTSSRNSELPTETSNDAAEITVTNPASETRRLNLERQMSSLVASSTHEDPAQQEEEVRKRDEKEIQDDYRDQEGDEQGREIEHLLLVTHGIGQRLGLRMESVNFVHDVNTLRKTLKAVYATSADLQALNSEVDKLPKNCRVQVLPICWRHKLDFPKQSLKHNRKEHDLGDAGFGEEEDYPNLDDITVEGVPAVRNLITDLALDILLYQSPAYKDHISRIVLEECNRIYQLFCERNPEFKGKVSLIGHSLGSAILFDILCRQQDGKQPHRRSSGKHHHKEGHSLQLDFPVEDFYGLGSPIGLFQMLKGRTITARHSPNVVPAQTPGEEGPELLLRAPTGVSNSEILVSSPRCQQIFNIFHPTDPISYRIEPLISPAMASLKPQPLPYTKRGIFGAPVGQGLTGIGARVGQSVSGLWSSFSSGIASSLLNRSLGISAEDAGKLGGPTVGTKSSMPLSMSAGSNLSAGTVSTAPVPAADTEIVGDDKKRQIAQNVEDGLTGEHPPTLIDAEIVTLYSGFEKRRRSQQSDADSRDLGESPEWVEAEERGRKLRREEAKVRALNTNGRVDYSIQEGAFDISLIASIASHLSYWADED
ncbi:hypothetical protein LTR60_001280, partial [Cryomyces antarcticus]